MTLALWPPIVRGHAAGGQTAGSDVQDVFVNRSADATKPDTVYFVSARSGLSSTFPIDGTAETLFSSGVLYQDRSTGRPFRLAIDGTSVPIAFMAAPPTQIAGWVVSPDGLWIAWVKSHTEAKSLLSDLIVAQSDGSQKQVAVHTSSTVGVGVVPIAISYDGAVITYSRQSAPTVSPIYLTGADVSVWRSGTAAPTHLPGEPLCACVAAMSANGRTVIRFDQRLTAHVIDLSSGSDLTIAPPAGLNAASAGDVLIQPGGALIAYSAATAADVRTARYGLILIDTARQRQTVLISPGPVRYQPIAFTADSILLSAVNQNGTARIPLTGGKVIALSANSYLGTLNNVTP